MSIYGLMEGIGLNAVCKESLNIVWRYKIKIVY
jgi:hypothetical protein